MSSPGYDLTSRQFHAHPYTTFQEMQARDPIYPLRTPSGRSVWYITRYRDVRAALEDPRLVKDLRNALTPEMMATQSPLRHAQRLLTEHMLTRDPPDHTRLRRLVGRAFTTGRIRELAPRIRLIANELLDVALERTHADMIAAFAFPLPIIVICEMLGVPSDDRAQIRQWSNDLLLANEVDMNPARYQRLERSISEFAHYTRGLLDDRRANPRDDLMTLLLQAEEQGGRLTEDEIVSMILLLAIAGHETTVNLIGNGLLTLLGHPDTMARVRDDRSLLAATIEEILRFRGPVSNSTRRWAAEDFVWRDRHIRRGDIVFVVLGAANRDDDVFDRAQRFDIDRSDSGHHLAFGYGVHYCLGAPLARLEARIALDVSLDRLPHDARLDVPETELEWCAGHLIHGLQALPISWA